jgi:hypothetical protein
VWGVVLRLLTGGKYAAVLSPMIGEHFPLLWNLYCLLFLYKAVNKSSTKIEVSEWLLKYRKPSVAGCSISEISPFP